MTHNTFPPIKDRLTQLSERMEAWRKDPKKSRYIPEELWQAAVDLTKDYSIYHISKTLRLNYKDLKNRVKSQMQGDLAIDNSPSPSFIELDIKKTSPSEEQCIVTMEDGNGAKMTIQLQSKRGLDLYELSRSFWKKRP